MHGQRSVFPYLIGLLEISSLFNHHSFFNVPAKHDELLHVTFKVLPVYIKISLGTQVHVTRINGMCVCTKYINKVGSNALNMLSLPKEPLEHTPYWCLSWNEIDNKHANASVREHGCIPQPWCSSRKKWKEKKNNKKNRTDEFQPSVNTRWRYGATAVRDCVLHSPVILSGGERTPRAARRAWWKGWTWRGCRWLACEYEDLSIGQSPAFII